MTGTLYGLGVGPGDPELLTLKALRILREVPVIAYPAPEKGDSMTRAIAAAHLPGGQAEIALRMPMIAGDAPADAHYDRYVSEIVAHLEAGRDVAVLCEGDPLFYGSFMYVLIRLEGGHPVEVVPGVSSLTACAAAAAMPLVSRNETLAVLPAPLPEEELEARLVSVHAAAIMKVGRHLPKVRRVLSRLGLDDDARYVERASLDGEKVLPLNEVDDGRAPYFSTIIVRKGTAAAP